MAKLHFYTFDQVDFMRKNIENMTWGELANRFNSLYGTDLNWKAIAQAAIRRGIKSGRTGQFQKGNAPWNKGKKGICIGGKETQFKVGNRPHTWVPVGTEIIDGDGYAKVKVANPNKWRFKHRMIWEEHNGPIPKGHVVIFGDGDKRNLDIDNLLLVSRAQLARMNQKGLIQNDAELTKTGIIVADIYNKIGERRRKQ